MEIAVAAVARARAEPLGAGSQSRSDLARPPAKSCKLEDRSPPFLSIHHNNNIAHLAQCEPPSPSTPLRSSQPLSPSTSPSSSSTPGATAKLAGSPRLSSRFSSRHDPYDIKSTPLHRRRTSSRSTRCAPLFLISFVHSTPHTPSSPALGLSSTPSTILTPITLDFAASHPCKTVNPPRQNRLNLFALPSDLYPPHTRCPRHLFSSTSSSATAAQRPQWASRRASAQDGGSAPPTQLAGSKIAHLLNVVALLVITMTMLAAPLRSGRLAFAPALAASLSASLKDTPRWRRSPKLDGPRLEIACSITVRLNSFATSSRLRAPSHDCGVHWLREGGLRGLAGARRCATHQHCCLIRVERRARTARVDFFTPTPKRIMPTKIVYNEGDAGQKRIGIT